VLGEGPGFLVRANLWTPPKPPRPGSREVPRRTYELPHDHNFSFLTVGHLGAGYRTEIWECDPARTAGYPGERVDLRFLEGTTLDQGKIMFYRASTDVHRQHLPEELSVSLNLMYTPPDRPRRNQYVFDVERSAVESFVPIRRLEAELVLCELAGHVGDGRTADILEDIAAHHELPQVRWAAFDSLATLAADASDAVIAAAVSDPHPYVSSRAREQLDRGK